MSQVPSRSDATRTSSSGIGPKGAGTLVPGRLMEAEGFRCVRMTKHLGEATIEIEVEGYEAEDALAIMQALDGPDE